MTPDKQKHENIGSPRKWSQNRDERFDKSGHTITKSHDVNGDDLEQLAGRYGRVYTKQKLPAFSPAYVVPCYPSGNRRELCVEVIASNILDGYNLNLNLAPYPLCIPFLTSSRSL